jgi:release factor glutamine methyltransferase
MKIETAIASAVRFLKKLQNPQLEVEVLCAAVIGKDRVFCKTHPEFKMSFWQSLKFRRYVRLRLQGMPIAQILKHKIWCGFEFYLNNNVLIPRDETEYLMEIMVTNNREFVPKRILDVGTGSGAIAVFMAKKFPQADVVALDISKSALRVARKNAKRHNAEIDFRCSDMLEKIKLNAKFDLIIANLPYVPNNFCVQDEVRHEPAKAIFSHKGGLELIEKLEVQLREKKIKFQELWLEFLPFQKDEIMRIFQNYDVKFCTDVGGDVYFACVKDNGGVNPAVIF